MPTKKITEEVITIPSIETSTAVLKIVGDSPLICHAWSEKARRMIREAGLPKSKSSKKEPRNPEADFFDSLYWLTERPENLTLETFQEAIDNGARFGFPSTGLKASAVAGGFRDGVIKSMASVRGAFHIQGEYVQIDGTPTIREDMVRVGLGSADIRWRAEFKEWSCVVPITFNSGVLTVAHIANLFNHGGCRNRRLAPGA